MGDGISVMNERLTDKLKIYSEGDSYPYHMPGHKRRDFFDFPENVAAMDITEIDGFDNLHESSGILMDVERRIADIYGADESHMLINGSTAGVLSAISACMTGKDDEKLLILGRNSHKSAYSAAYLMDARTEYLYGDENMLVSADETEGLLSDFEAAKRKVNAVFITSPTYEGAVLDVEKIANTCHLHNVPLIVDAAHGAHLGFSEEFGKNPVKLGADICIMSLHKTLPSLTQTAVIHICGGRVDRNRLGRFLKIYQTSSPSYILMASIDECINFLVGEMRKKHNRFDIFAELYHEFVQKCEGLTHIYAGGFVSGDESVKADVGKCIIRDRQGALTGKDIYDILRTDFHLQLEFAAIGYCLAMLTVMDNEEAYERLFAALKNIDENYDRYVLSKAGNARHGKRMVEKKIRVKIIRNSMDKAECEAVSDIKAAWDAPYETVDIDDAEGAASAEFICAYPPGSPILVPGEHFAEETVQRIKYGVEAGLNVQGIEII